jgi:hypothetical protein
MSGVAEMTLIDGRTAAEFRIDAGARMVIIIIDGCRQRRLASGTMRARYLAASARLSANPAGFIL